MMKPQNLLSKVVLLAVAGLPALALPSDLATFKIEARSDQTPSRKELWKPEVGNPWQISLSKVIKLPKGGVPDLEPNVPIYDADLFDNTIETFAALRQAGKRVICYFSAGSWENWRPDKGSFQQKDLGKTLGGWPDEKWIDISSPAVRAIMASRIKLAAEKGCDAIDPDNLDGYENDNGLGLTKSDTISYVKFLSTEAAKYYMTTGMKNGGSITKSVIAYVGFCINESCIRYAECDLYAPYIEAGKPSISSEPIVDWRRSNRLENNRRIRQQLGVGVTDQDFHTRDLDALPGAEEVLEGVLSETTAVGGWSLSDRDNTAPDFPWTAHATHISIFQDIIQASKDPATAAQALTFQFYKMIYYDQLPSFNIVQQVMTVNSTEVLVPVQQTGLGLVLGLVGMHFAISQMVSSETKETIEAGSEMRDKDVTDYGMGQVDGP
ncbi:hypothetical protein ACJ41O_012577 [Fusarium nematophilum]